MDQARAIREARKYRDQLGIAVFAYEMSPGEWGVARVDGASASVAEFRETQAPPDVSSRDDPRLLPSRLVPPFGGA